MLTRRFIIAVLSAPAAAAVTFYLLWLTWLIVFVSRKPEEFFADWYAAASLLRTWPVIAVAFVCALMVELVVGLPLLAFFQRIRWLSFSAFLAGGCATAFAFYFATHGPELPAHRDLAATAVLLLAPGCIGALVFGYVGGWLTSRWSGPA